MMDTLEGYTGTIAVGGMEITNLRFTEDINLIAGSKDELADFTRLLDLKAQ